MPKILSLLLVLFLASCGGGGSGGSGPVVAAVSRIEIQSNGLMLLGTGQSSQLTVLAYDASGNRLDGITPSWTSSAPTTLSVDQAGRLVALVDNGSAQITAVVAQVSSAPATAVVSVPVDKVTVLTDSDVVSEPTLVDPTSSLDSGTLFNVSLGPAGTSLPVGSVVLSTGSRPFLGRITALSGGVATIAAIAPLDEFPHLQVDEVLSLANATPVISPEIAALFDVSSANGVFTFDQKAGTTIESSNARDGVHPLAVKALDRLECKGSSSVIKVKISGASTKVDLSKASKVARLAGTGSKFLIDGPYEVSSKASLSLSLDPGVKASCKLTLFYLPIKATGWLAALLGVNVPVGLKLDVEATGAKLDAIAEAKIVTAGSIKVGVDCTQSCAFPHELTAKTTGSPLNFPPLAPQARLGYSVALDGYIEVSALDFPKWTKIDSVFLTTAKVGPKFAVEAASAEFQTNQTFTANYKVTVDATIANGDEFEVGVTQAQKDFFKKWLKIDLVGFNYEFNLFEANSPTADVTIDSIPLQAGDPFTVLVDFQPKDIGLLIFYPYSVKDLRIFFSDASGKFNDIPIQFLDAADGKTHFAIPLIATDAMIGGTIYAFMDSKADSLMLHSPMKLGSQSLAAKVAVQSASCANVYVPKGPVVFIEDHFAAAGTATGTVGMKFSLFLTATGPTIPRHSLFGAGPPVPLSCGDWTASTDGFFGYCTRSPGQPNSTTWSVQGIDIHSADHYYFYGVIGNELQNPGTLARCGGP